ncbi:UvrD-helicase domain-containing protein [Geofilum rhodophaeum]|uniref:UvrD-helicase domain-containing protein n=1 Tax=Geofilum rhodophaeum TaxID=1965019 RepID=UPI000B52664F|nr:UvrD-helicase domain-containing protein [Geofilum rhodophaeum]
MAQLKVYRASAGSGKTFRLTGEYLQLLFKDPLNYRQILAVTFTNKATAEMRSRILSALNQLAAPEQSNSPYLSDLKKHSQLSTQEVKARASLLLALLLHDFSRFSISTIDSFFQKVTRSFAREMGLPIGFRLELETQHLMQQAIDQLILEMNAPRHQNLKQWLLDFARERMEEDSKWNISGEIASISNEIFKEKYQEHAVALSRQIGNKNYLATYKNALREIMSNTDRHLRDLGEKALALLTKYNLDVREDFKGRTRAPALQFERMARGEEHLDLKRHEKLLKGIEEWQRKENSAEKNAAIEAAYNEGLAQIVRQAVDYLHQEGRNYYTAQVVLKHLNALGLINDVYEKMMALCRAQNIFMISGTNHLLTRIIANNDTPFIYEKTGTRYAHYMMDEFQDTSSLQYQNFIPLVKDALAGGHYALMVGDVKQAIYRWRNSDWNLLAEEVEKDYAAYGVDLNTLDTNWRSSKDVIAFNNGFFTQAAGLLQEQFNQLVPEDLKDDEALLALQSKISKAYFDVEQKVASKGQQTGGQVVIQLHEAANKDDFYALAGASAVARIVKLLDEGYALSDICVLVRKNKEGVEITNALLSGLYHPQGTGLPVISNEALLLSKSEAVNLIVEQLRFIQNPDNQLAESFVRLHLFKSQKEKGTALDLSLPFHSKEIQEDWEAYLKKLSELRELPLYELVEALAALLPESLRNSHSVYLQSFLSLCLNYINQESADINPFIAYWDLRGVKVSLSIPDKQEAIRVMSIHKSKGLEFRAVVLPYADWDNVDARSNLLWLKPQTPPFDALTLVPVMSSKILTETHFAADYLDEILHQYVDNLNVTYVAFTRARESLTIITSVSPEKKDKGSRAYKSLGDLLQAYVEQEGKNHYDENSKCYELDQRQLPPPPSKEETINFRPENSIPAKNLQRLPLGRRARIHLDSSAYFSKEENGPINHGTLMHRLFEQIETSADLEPALTRMRLEGWIEGAEEEALRQKVQHFLQHPQVQTWFNGTYTIKTEAAILSAKIRRPDRVMIREGEVVVVDYKFGQQKNPAHHTQVRSYMQLLYNMGYSKIKAYLWYAESNEVLQVNGQGSLF